MASWFRSWHGAPTDNKYLTVAKKSGAKPAHVSAVIWALMDYASQHDERGSVEGFDVEDYAVWSGLEEDEVAAIINCLECKGIIENAKLASWGKRQPEKEDSTAAERKRRQRSREMSRHVTPCHAPDTDTDTDKKNTKKSLEKEFEEEFWPITAKKKSKAAARKAYVTARSKAERVEILTSWRTHNAECKSKMGTDEWEFVPYPATWLNGERWLDESDPEPPRRDPNRKRLEDFDNFEQYQAYLKSQQ